MTILFIVKYEKITLFDEFSVVGAHYQQVFGMFKWGKKQRVLTLVLSLWAILTLAS